MYDRDLYNSPLSLRHNRRISQVVSGGKGYNGANQTEEISVSREIRLYIRGMAANISSLEKYDAVVSATRVVG